MAINADNEDVQDPSQVFAPYVPWGMEWHGFRIANLKYAAPGAFVSFLGGSAWLFRIPGGIPLAALGGAISAGGVALASATPEETTAYDRMKAPITQWWRNRSLPYSEDDAAVETVHGVKRIHHDGTAEMSDGRMVAMVRLTGSNTDMKMPSATQTLVSTLRRGLDERLGGTSFTYHSTTTDFDVSVITDEYRKRTYSESFGGDEWKPLRALMLDIASFIEKNHEVWGTREWNHYAVVDAKPWEVDADSQAAERRAVHDLVQERVKKEVIPAHNRVPGVEPCTVGPVEHATILAEYWTGVSREFSPEAVSSKSELAVWPHPDPYDENAADSPRPEAVDDDDTVSNEGVVAPERIKAVSDGGEQAVQSVSSTTATDDPGDVLDGEDAEDASFFARVREAFLAPLQDNEDELGDTNRVRDLLSPSTYDDTGDGYLKIGDQLTRTYWVGSWPIQPEGKFLDRLYNLRGVDVDVTIRADARDRDETIEKCKQKIGEMDADVAEMRDRADISARTVLTDAEAYEQMFDLLNETNTHPWAISGYVTVRAGTRRALSRAHDELERGYRNQDELSLDILQQEALEDDCEKVVKAMEDAPAHLTATTSKHRQPELFESCSPNGRDIYDETSIRDRKTLALTGALSAVLPFSSSVVHHDGGVIHGRNMQNGTLIVSDPFQQGKAPHKITIGDSGAGKSTYVLSQALRWKSMDDDRTLILCDNFGDFAGITEITNGKHIVVGGRQTINPLHIEETPKHVLDAEDIDPYNMKSTEITQFLTGLLRSQGIDAGEYYALIQDILRETYADFDIYPGDVESHGNSPKPTMQDFINKTREMADNPESFVMGGSRSEIEELERNAGKLLRKLGGFQQGREYAHFVGEDDADIQLGGVTYLDLQQTGRNSGPKTAAMLQLMMGKVYEAVKEAPGETMFVIDEAHNLLHNDEMIDWLEKAARHWRHFDACLWFASQSPHEFVSSKKDEGRQKDVIRGQCSTKEFFRTEDLEEETAKLWGLNERQTAFIKKYATTGKDSDHSQCLINFMNEEGWMRSEVELSQSELNVLDYTPGEDGEFDDYFWNRRSGGGA